MDQNQNKILTAEDVLKHHGVIGQKWGIRRYQNKDGSLTPAGKKRARKLLDKYEKLTGKKVRMVKGKPVAKPKAENPDREFIKKISDNKDKDNKITFTKDIKDMTNDELRKVTNRLNAESDFISAVNKRNSFNKKQVETGKSWLSKVKDDVIVPSVTGAAKTQTEEWLNRIFAQVYGNNRTKSNKNKNNNNKKK